MELVGDRRGQSIQIGAVLLFGVLIIAFSSYQAFVVPDQNQEVEFNHNQEVHSDMQDVRNTIVSAPGGGSSRSVSVQLGTQYPSRAIARNPGPPSGSLRTIGTTDAGVELSIANAQASGETGDFWNGRQAYNTGALRYTPQYNLYTQAPDTVYENTILYNDFRSGSITLANQTFIDGNDISLVTLDGSVSRSSSQTASLDIRPVSSSTQTVRIEDDGDPLTISFVSTRPASYWNFLENTESTVSDGAVSDDGLGNGLYNVSVELDSGTYDVQLTKVGVGTQVTDENAAYLTDTDGDGDTVVQGSTTELTLEVRDRYNNPPDNASETTVEGTVDGSGSFVGSGSETPDSDGEVTFTYQAPSSGTGDREIDFTFGSLTDGTFAASTPQDVTMTVTVTDSSGSGGGGGGGGGGSVTVSNGQTGSSNSELEFTVENTDSSPVTFTGISVDSYSDNTSPSSDDAQEINNQAGGAEVIIDSTDSFDGTFSIGSGEKTLSPSLTLAGGGTTAQFNVLDFSRKNGDAVDISGSTIEITLYFDSIPNKTVTLNP